MAEDSAEDSDYEYEYHESLTEVSRAHATHTPLQR